MHIFTCMVKTSVKFQKNLNITVGGVACTRYPLSIHFHCQNVGEVVCTRDPLSIHFHCVNVEKESKLKLRKKCQKLI